MFKALILAFALTVGAHADVKNTTAVQELAGGIGGTPFGALTYALNNAITGTSSSAIDLSGTAGLWLTLTSTASANVLVYFSNANVTYTTGASQMYIVGSPGSYPIPPKARYVSFYNGATQTRVSAFYYKLSPALTICEGCTVNVTSLTADQGAPGSAPWPVADTRTADAVERTYGATTQTAQNTADLLEIFKVLDLQTALGSAAYDSSLSRLLTSSKVEAWGNAAVADATQFSGAITTSDYGPEVKAGLFAYDQESGALGSLQEVTDINTVTRLLTSSMTSFDDGMGTSQNVNPTNGLPGNLVGLAGDALTGPWNPGSGFFDASNTTSNQVVGGLTLAFNPTDNGYYPIGGVKDGSLGTVLTVPMFDLHYLAGNVISSTNAVPITGTVTTVAAQATANSLENTNTTIFQLKTGGNLLQNYTLTAKWNGAVTADTFTATLEGSPTGDFAGEEVVLATVTQAGLSAGAQLKPYAYTRVNLSALTLVTADSLNLYATGMQ